MGWCISLGFGCRLLNAGASLAAEHRLQLCGLHRGQFPGSRAQAQELRLTGSVDPRLVESSGPGIKPESPALAGGFSTTEPPGKP